MADDVLIHSFFKRLGILLCTQALEKSHQNPHGWQEDTEGGAGTQKRSLPH